MDNKFYDKVYACWLGKNIGGTLGAPYEGWASKLNISFFDDFDEGTPLPNDDLDLQLVNLHAIEQHGTHLTMCEISEEWKEHVFFPYDEYGYALLNLRRGIKPPLSGFFDNSFRDCMGSPIRSELWAAIAAGKPKLAAYFAMQDASVDHAGGEGVYGEVFFTVLECLAYENDDIQYIINEALKYIPDNCRTACALSDTLHWHDEGVTYDEIREKILCKYGNDNFTDAPQNIAFTIVGLLYGNDFEDVLLKTVNMGYDTDCTAATVGSIYGILYGTEGIPEKWSKPVGSNIIVSPEVKGLDYPKTIEELTKRTIKQYELLDDEMCETLFDPAYKGIEWQCIKLSKYGMSNGGINIFINGENGPLVINGENKSVRVCLLNRTSGDWKVEVELRGSKSSAKEVVLPYGKETELVFDLPITDECWQTINGELLIRRIHDGNIWAVYKVPFVLPYASKWLVNGEEKFFNNGTVVLNKEGKNLLETTLNVPSPREIQIVGACSDEYVLYVDDIPVINCAKKELCLPAFHRAPESHFEILKMESGTHKIRVEVNVNEDGSVFALLPVAPKYISEAGRNYYHIDCDIGL